MAAKAKAEAPPDEDDDKAESEEGTGNESKDAKKSGLAGRILAPVVGLARDANPLAILKLPLKQKLIAAGALVLVLAGASAGIYFLLGSSAKEAGAGTESVRTAAANLPPAQAAFFDVPDIIVNIQTTDATPAFLKLTVSLELEKAEAKAAIEPVMPRVVDQFQTYLRELRVEDVRGSAGVMRLKEELLRRVNLAVAPTPVRDVLLKEMIVQ
jgi:flagellar FliL protein